MATTTSVQQASVRTLQNASDRHGYFEPDMRTLPADLMPFVLMDGWSQDEINYWALAHATIQAGPYTSPGLTEMAHHGYVDILTGWYPMKAYRTAMKIVERGVVSVDSWGTPGKRFDPDPSPFTFTPVVDRQELAQLRRQQREHVAQERRDFVAQWHAEHPESVAAQCDEALGDRSSSTSSLSSSAPFKPERGVIDVEWPAFGDLPVSEHTDIAPPVTTRRPHDLHDVNQSVTYAEERCAPVEQTRPGSNINDDMNANEVESVNDSELHSDPFGSRLLGFDAIDYVPKTMTEQLRVRRFNRLRMFGGDIPADLHDLQKAAEAKRARRLADREAIENDAPIVPQEAILRADSVAEPMTPGTLDHHVATKHRPDFADCYICAEDR